MMKVAEMKQDSNPDMRLTVSPVCKKGGETYAFVTFTEGNRYAQQGVRVAEGKIPDCKIISNKGFDEGEVGMLEMYMKQNLLQLKKMAAGIRLFDVITKE